MVCTLRFMRSPQTTSRAITLGPGRGALEKGVEKR
jgi:hypothetical protein